MMTTLYLYMKLTGRSRLIIEILSLMLLATLKIVLCLKNYCYHDHDNRHIVKSLLLPQSLCQNV